MEILGSLFVQFEPEKVAEIVKAHVEKELNMSVKEVGWSVDINDFFFTVNLNAEVKPANCKPKNLPAAKPPQQESSQQEDSSPHTPEKQEEGLRNDSGKKKHEASLNGKVKTTLTERILAVITEAGWATSKYIQDQLDEDFNKVPKLLWQLDKKGHIQKRRVPTKYGKRYEYSLAGYEGKSDLEPEPPNLSPNAQTVLDTLKKFDCLTFYTKICEAVDLPEIEVTKAIRELKVAKRIFSPREKPMHYQVV